MKQTIKLMLVLAFASTSMGLQAMDLKIEEYTWSDSECKKTPNLEAAKNAILGKFTNIAGKFKAAQLQGEKDFWGDVTSLLITQIRNCYNTAKAPRGAETFIQSLLSAAQGKGPASNPKIFDRAPSNDELALRAILAMPQYLLIKGNLSDGTKNELVVAIDAGLTAYNRDDALSKRAEALSEAIANVPAQGPEEKPLAGEKELDAALKQAKQVRQGLDPQMNKTLKQLFDEGAIAKITPLIAAIQGPLTIFANALAGTQQDPGTNDLYIAGAGLVANLDTLIDDITKAGAQQPPPPVGPRPAEKQAAQTYLQQTQTRITQLGAMKAGNETKGDLPLASKAEFEAIQADLEDGTNAWQIYSKKLAAANMPKDNVVKWGDNLLQITKNAVARAKAPAAGEPSVEQQAYDKAVAAAKAVIPAQPCNVPALKKAQTNLEEAAVNYTGPKPDAINLINQLKARIKACEDAESATQQAQQKVQDYTARLNKVVADFDVIDKAAKVGGKIKADYKVSLNAAKAAITGLIPEIAALPPALGANLATNAAALAQKIEAAIGILEPEKGPEVKFSADTFKALKTAVNDAWEAYNEDQNDATKGALLAIYPKAQEAVKNVDASVEKKEIDKVVQLLGWIKNELEIN